MFCRKKIIIEEIEKIVFKGIGSFYRDDSNNSAIKDIFCVSCFQSQEPNIIVGNQAAFHKKRTLTGTFVAEM